MSDNDFGQRGQNGNGHSERGQTIGRKPPETSADVQPTSDQRSMSGEPSVRTGARRGFAAMDQQMQREIARKGGHSQGKENNRGNFWHDRERARIAGRKGGEAHGKNRQESPPDPERH